MSPEDKKKAYGKTYRDKNKAKIAVAFRAWYLKQTPEWKQQHSNKVAAYQMKKREEQRRNNGV